ncbi:ATP synthase F0 subunit B [Streptomyces sp. CB02009]|uniref:ATP synthase F0 subunit B n=1 Tax=Streptomyces sp. CB02009 TaxID=1703938 RepID=UPI0009A0CB64|nr:ATP synthase F0 subunit B [Streptomyces sp. CB02009]
MANSPTRRRRKPSPAVKSRGAGGAQALEAPAFPIPTVTAEGFVPQESVLTPFVEADRLVADAADRAADLRDLAADDAARIVADGEQRASALLDLARVEAASITEAATTEHTRVLADAQAEAGQVRTQAVTTAAADADQTRARAAAEAEQLLISARREADTVTETAAGEAEQILAESRLQAQEVTRTASAEAEEVRTRAETAAAKVMTDAETRRTELLEAAEHAAAATRAAADAAAEQVQTDAARHAAAARKDADRTTAAATADAARTVQMAKEDAQQQRTRAAQDAERAMAQSRAEAGRIREQAQDEADRLLDDVRARQDAVAEREDALHTAGEQARELAEQAAAAMRKATDATERRLARRRLKDQAADERRAAKAAHREGRTTFAERSKKWAKTNAERLLVVGPITAPMAVAWTGQAGFATDILGWVAPFTVLFAAAWELSTAFVGWMYHQARKAGDAGLLYRVSTWVFAMGAAVMNFWHASGEPVAGSRVWDAAAQEWTQQVTYWNFTPKAVAFAAMSIVGMVLWELYATLIHRKQLREDGKVADSRPSIGLVRWLRYPRHSFTAWSLTITDQRLSTLDRAWTAAETSLARKRTLQAARRGVPLPRSYRVVPVSASLTPTGIPGLIAQSLGSGETWTVERIGTGTAWRGTGTGPAETETSAGETGTTGQSTWSETGPCRALPSGARPETGSAPALNSRDHSETGNSPETTRSRTLRETGRTRHSGRAETGETETAHLRGGSETETGGRTETKTTGTTASPGTCETETTGETGTDGTSALRETGRAGTVVPLGDPETETRHLLDLMKSRGGAEKVSLDDAIAETGRPRSTAAKRLAAARDQYRTLPRVPYAAR